MLKKHSNKKIILSTCAVLLVLSLLLGVDGYIIGSFFGGIVSMPVIITFCMVIPAFPLAIYSKIKSKTFFISKKMIKISFVIGSFIALVIISVSGYLTTGHFFGLFFYAISIFRKNPEKNNLTNEK